jgi:hypothetical protein
MSGGRIRGVAHRLREGRRGLRRPTAVRIALSIALAAVVWLAAAATASAVGFASQTYPTGGDPGAVATGDFNGDGQPDMVTANASDGTVSVLLGNGDGTFQTQKTFAVGTRPRGVAVGDFNGDGKLDLAVTNANDNTVSVLLGNGDGTFQPQTPYAVGSSPGAIAVGDFNGDGRPDIVVGNYGLGCCNDNGSLSVLIGNGDGTFRPQQVMSAFYPGTVAVGDFNGDGKLDLAVGQESSSGGVQIYLGNGDGTFQAGGSYGNQYDGSSVAVGDLNGDGKLDLVTSNWGENGTVSVLLGNGDGTFQSAQAYDVTGQGYGAEDEVVIADLNGDGTPDIAVASQDFGTVSVLLGNGDGTFGNLSTEPTASYIPTALAAADFNGDGKPDLVSTSQWGPSSADVLLNDSFGFVSAETRASSSTAGAGSVLINQLRLTGPSGPADQYVELYNTETSPVAVGGWELEGSQGGFTQLLYGTVIPAHGHLLLTGAAYSLSSTATSNGELPSGSFQEPAAGGFRLVASTGAIIDAAGFTGAEQPRSVWFEQFGYTQAGVGPNSVATGDLNGDGMPDLVVANGGTSSAPGNTVSVFTEHDRLRAGDFNGATSYTVGNHPNSVAVGDFNGDHKLDAVVTNLDDNDVSVLLGNGDGTFQAQTTYATVDSPAAVAVGDFNGDHHPDLVVNGLFGLSVLLGNGDGTFQPATSIADAGFGPAVAVGDVNGDGKLDILAADLGTAASPVVDVLLGNGDGTFQPPQQFAIGGVPSALALGDFNNDGHPDLAASIGGSLVQPGNTVSVLLGNGDGTFQTPQSYTVGTDPSGVVVGDFDGDGVSDLAVTNYTDGTVSLLFGNGDGTFTPQQRFVVGTSEANPGGDPGSGPAALAVGNFDLYGRPSLAVVSANKPGIALLGNRISGGGTFFAGHGLAVPPSYPSGQFAWTRAVTSGPPVNTGDNRADFSYISTDDNDPAHGSPALGTPDPANLASTPPGPPVVSRLSPSAGSTAGGNTVTITGSGFVRGARVRFGSVYSSSVRFVSSTELRAVAPAEVVTPKRVWMVNVVVHTAAGPSATGSATLYVYGAPVVSGVSPRAGSTAGGNTVTIRGSGFVPGARVRFGGVYSSSVTFVSSTELQAVAPAEVVTPKPERVVNVVVHTAAGPSATGSATLYAYGAPVVSGVSPRAGSTAGGNTVTIRGSGFVPGARVRFGRVYSSSVTFVSSTELLAVAPAEVVTPKPVPRVNVVVHTAAGASATSSADLYSYTSP